MCSYYPCGYRTSNDIDLLTLPENVTEIGKILEEAGFKQGNIRNGEFVAATRKEIIESKMMRGETVPYIKEINLPFMKYLEVDINFSLDYKNGKDGIIEKMLHKTRQTSNGTIKIPTLSKEDFFIHLCTHLYKEATTLPWIKMKRDMTLYKYCDIYMLLDEMSEKNVEEMYKNAGEYGLEKICAFAILQTAELFDIKDCFAIKVSKMILASDPEFLHFVVSPSEKKSFCYKTKGITDRFFSENRVTDLTEVR